MRWWLLVPAVLGVAACASDPEVSESGAPVVPVEEASVRGAGTSLASGFVVPAGTSLVGAVVPSAGISRSSTHEWMATLVVTGDPRQVMADLERQADLLGLPFLTAGGAPPFSCGGFDGDDFAGSLDLDSGDPSDVEGFRCGAVAANDASTASLHVDLLRLTWPGDVAASHLFLRYVTEGPSPDWAGGLPVRNDRAPLRVPEQWPVLAVEGQQVAPWPPLDVVTVEPGSLLVAPPRLDELFSAGDAMIRITADRGAVIDAYQRQFQKITGSAPSMDTSLVVPGGQVRRWHHTGAGGHSIDAYVFGTEPSWLYISVTDD